jgi:hypothetical protein
MMGFTKGPWRVDETIALGAYGVWTDYATHPGDDGRGYGSQICSVYPSNQSDVPREERDANAHLIAAAPDLYVACKMLEDDPGLTDSANDVIKFALAKARGEQVAT